MSTQLAAGDTFYLSPSLTPTPEPPAPFATPHAQHPVAKFNASNSQYEKFIKKANSKSLSEMENQIELPKNLRREAPQRCEVYMAVGHGAEAVEAWLLTLFEQD